ncbi:MAG: FtsX-like permease family protein [Pseudomonadales bacterium]|jgi:lipoprotein-releasing system permease protein
MTHWVLSVSLRMASKLGKNALYQRTNGLPVAGLSFAVAILVMVLSVVNGFEVAMRERVLSLFPHVLIYDRNQMQLNQAQIEVIASHEQILATAPIMEIGGMLIANGAHQGILISAIDPVLEPKVNDLPSYLTGGQWSGLLTEPFSMVISQQLADVLKLSLNDRVTLMLPIASFSLAGISTRSKRFTVVGIFDTATDLDRATAYINLAAGSALGGQRFPQGLRLKLNDLFEAANVLQSIYYANPAQPIFGSSWMSRQGSLYAAIGLQKRIMFILLALLVAVAAFNVTSQLVIYVEERRSDIAILKTLGANAGEIRRIFLLQGMTLGLIGTSAGLALGFIACDAINWGLMAVQNFFHINLLEEYFVHYLPFERLLSDFLWVAFVSLLLCFIASVYPAHRAAKMMISEGLNDGS